ncbi:radical SAM family heme chaperone HemW [Spiroplasma endosymbiont of Amphibalanus improvisus]|uniref:radical SAM family heme chaperone HemW n=1 Tax=Spiroplasma endosymbiont of Amphibalanus improvisus TaxID=3066327 RepID=UPI00313C0787
MENSKPAFFKYLYIHIPFCEKICFFCDFFKFKKNIKTMELEYTESLLSQIKKNGPFWDLRTIYIGGGTPSCLDYDCWIKIFKALKPFTNNIEEFTIEVNPESVSEKLLKLFVKNKVNRISMGCQTFNDELLQQSNRKHNKKDILEKYCLIQKMGIQNISIDLIYNLFNQTKEDVIADLKMVKKLKPSHLSWYSLILKSGTVWGRKYLELPDNDYEFDNIINEELSRLGYERYEVSNYASKGNYRSIHNLSYWRNESYDAIGPSAAGFSNLNFNRSYLIHNDKNYKNWNYEIEYLSKEDYYFKILMMGLRLVDGININDIKDADLAIEYFWIKIEKQINNNLLIYHNDVLKCSSEGFNFLDSVLLDILN